MLNKSDAEGLWGNHLYTSDSNICGAAVHVGLIDWQTGGVVTAVVAPGQEFYIGRDLNDISSANYGSYNRSLTFAALAPADSTIRWGTSLNSFGLANEDNLGREFLFRCAPADNPRDAEGLWGSDIYTSDSNICGAAVHTGLISSSSGGMVNAVVSPGQEFYVGSDRNGVSSSNYAAYNYSLSLAATAAIEEADGAGSSETSISVTVPVVQTVEQLETAIAYRGSVSVYGIQFEFDRADILPQSETTLERVSELLVANPDLELQIVGHTDNLGSMEYNLDLSARRATAVVNALVSDYSIAADRLEAAGASYRFPVAANDTEAGRALNRRVELKTAQ